MPRCRIRLLVVSAFLGIYLLLSGCATLGPVYQKVDPIPEGTGIVYIYRPSAFGGSGVSYDVKVGETVITTLYNGGYHPYVSKPGEIEFWAKTESRSAVTLDIAPGQIYYLKGTVGIGFFVGRPHLMVIPEETALKEIGECKLIPPPEKSKE